MRLPRLSLNEMIIILGIAAMACSSPSWAGFLVVQTAAWNVSGSGFDVYQYAVLNNGEGGTGTKLVGISLDIKTVDYQGIPSTDYGLKVDLSSDYSGDGVNEANIFGGPPSGAVRNFGSVAGTFARIGNNTVNWVGVASGQSPFPFDTDPDGDQVSDSPINPAYLDLHTLHIEGISLLPPDASNTPVKFANIVVPAGRNVLAHVSFLGDAGEFSAYQNAYSIIPEPSAFLSTIMFSMTFLIRFPRLSSKP